MASLTDQAVTAALCDLIKSNGDIQRACMVPNTDEDIICSIIWRFLVSQVFRTLHCSIKESTSRLAIVRELEDLMNDGNKSPEGVCLSCNLIY